jgi:hypothetical protein
MSVSKRVEAAKTEWDLVQLVWLRPAGVGLPPPADDARRPKQVSLGAFFCWTVSLNDDATIPQ